MCHRTDMVLGDIAVVTIRRCVGRYNHIWESLRRRCRRLIPKTDVKGRENKTQYTLHNIIEIVDRKKTIMKTGTWCRLFSHPFH